MNMKHLLFIILIFCSVTGGCKKNQVENTHIITIDMTEDLKEVPFNLNDYVTDLKVIRLETNENTLMRYFSGFVGDKYIIAIENDKVLLFSSKGKFLKTITTKGKGPQEFTQIDAWTVDENEDFFIYHDLGKNYINKYNLHNYQFEETIPFQDNGYLNNMLFIDDTTLTVLPGMFSSYGYLFFNQTIKGQITGGIKKENRPHPGAWAGRTALFKKYHDNSIIFQSAESDTVFRIEGTNMVPMYSFIVEKPIKNGDKTTGAYTTYLNSNEDELLLAKFNYESEKTPTFASMNMMGSGYYSFNLKTLQTRKIEFLPLEIMDIELGVPYISFPDKDKVLITSQAVYFKKLIEMTLKKEGIDESKKERLIKLNSEISENDNPILITGNWK